MAEKSPLSAEELQKLLRMLLKKADSEEATDFEEISEATDCVREKDIQRIIDLGLGRGVDATDRTPWNNKTSFQVRPVTIDNIIGTEEGGGEQSYEREITNSTETQGQVRASITDPKATVSIGVEGTYTHTSSSRYKVIGTKVLNRTISFKAHCNDSDIKLPPGSDTFETWLCKWILKNREGVTYDDLPPKKDFPDRVNQKILHILTESEIAEICSKFISQYKVTHYVSSIQLGASGYEVITESRKGHKLGMGTHIGVQKIAAGSASGSHSKTHHKKTTDVRKIGIIELKDGIATVKRGTHNEAVVGIQVRPISDLMTSRKLKEILQKALVRYTESKSDASVGPVLIRCVTDDLYLTVNGVGKKYLKATFGKKHASEFYLKPSGNPKHPEEFYICYFCSNQHNDKDDNTIEDDDTVEDAKSVPQYLRTPINIFGSHPGPLEFGYHIIRDKETRLVLQSSFRKHHQPPVSLSAWMSGNETCFIQCARRRKNGYLAVKQVQSEDSERSKQPEYSTCCVPSKHDSSVFQIVQNLEARVDRMNENGANDNFEPYITYDVQFNCTEEDMIIEDDPEFEDPEMEASSKEGSRKASLGEDPKLRHETTPNEHGKEPSQLK